MQLHWALRARADLRRIYDHYDEISPALADEIVAGIEETPLILLERPFLGVPVPNTPLRKWSVRKLPFVLLYRVMRDRVEVARVVHSATDWHSQS